MQSDFEKLRLLLENDIAYSIYILGIFEHYSSNQYKLNYSLGEYPNFGLIISECTSNNYLLLAGSKSIIEEIAKNIKLPKKNQLISANIDHLAILKKQYKLVNYSEQYRMMVTAENFQIDNSKHRFQIRKMIPKDIDIMKNFYLSAGHKINFDQKLIHKGAFYGAFKNNNLIACAGTHIISEKSQCAAIGNILTNFNYRGLGIAKKLTSLVTKKLLESNISKITLSVDIENSIAYSIYDKLGYKIVTKNFEGHLRKQSKFNFSKILN
jgi:predicted GNAT family acetyltransferase|tara:strand:- start:3265 stop:4065 length:801 start_codon:yes stop_codon:yes gene_type:complete